MNAADGKNDFALVPRPPSEIEKAEPGAKRVLSGMVADALALVPKARAAHPYAKFRIGDYDWCEPDYRQIMIWANALGLAANDVLHRLFGVQRKDHCTFHKLATWDGLPFSEGKLLKLDWNFSRLPLRRFDWVPGIKLTHFRILNPPEGEAWPLVDVGNIPSDKLVHLGFHCIRLDNLETTNLLHLQNLECCSSRSLKTLDLTPLKNLRQLTCCFNDLADLDLISVPKLRRLECWLNHITELDLSSTPELKYLSCDSNGIREIHL